MGKNYIEINYKKKYDGDYIKSYGNRRMLKKLYNEGVKSYKAITQKMSSYNKDEKGKYDGLEIDETSTIDVLGKTNRSRVQNIPTNRQVTTTTTKSKEQVVISDTERNPTRKDKINKPKEASSVSSTETVIVTPPPYISKDSEKVITPKKKVTQDYEFYRNMVTPPVTPLGNGLYRETNKKEIVDEREARKILSYAEYSPKEQFNLIIFYVVAVLFGFTLSIFGPICIVIWGVMTKGKNTTVYEKKLHMGTLSVTMPATEQEKANYQKRGQLYMNVGIVIGVIQLIRLFYF